jgi:putative pre-16S rRNA nuclease
LSGRPSHSAEHLRKVTYAPPGRLLAIDLGAKRVGVAVTDELHITVSALAYLDRRSWKDLLSRIAGIIESYDARALIIGLPLNLDGTKGCAADKALRIAENFRKSLNVPVFLQDERLTSLAAKSELKSRGADPSEIERLVDSEAAAIILRDFVAERDPSTIVRPGHDSPSDAT